MPGMRARAAALQREITEEIFLALGLRRRGWLQSGLAPFFRPATRRFSEIAAGFDDAIARMGLQAAARATLPSFSQQVTFYGEKPACSDGPLLVASNHPGTVDALAIAAHLPREDLKIISQRIPFLGTLQHTRQHLIFATRDAHCRMAAARQSLRHLQAGGALLVYPAGGIDPDPAVMSGAEEAIRNWSRSLELFLRLAPQTQVIVAIVSHVLQPQFVRNPLTRLRRKVRDRQRIAEFLQVIRQMVNPGKLPVRPRLSFSPVYPARELCPPSADGNRRDALIQCALTLLGRHMAHSQ